MPLVFPPAEKERPACETVRRLVFPLFKAAALLLLTGWASAAPRLALVDGPVATQKAGMTLWSKASVGDHLDQGEQVRTGVRAQATIVFDDDSRVELGGNATFVVAHVAPDSIMVKLPLGFLRAIISKIAARQFQVRTPTAVCSVRGTEFTVDVNNQGQTTVQMFEGVLAVSDGLGNEALVRDKQHINVTDKGLGPVQEGTHEGLPSKRAERREIFKQLARRELGFDMQKEQLQTAAALQAKTAVYQQGEVAINAAGNLVRIEEYIVRPTPTDFKLVVLNESVGQMSNFWYHGIFNTVLPTNLATALQELNGCIGTACTYYLTGFDTGRSNGIDTMLEIGSGGKQIDVNNDGVSNDAVLSAYNALTGLFVNLNVPNQGGTGNESYFQTLFDYDTLTFDGVPHNGWVPVGGSVTNYGSGAGGINSGSVALNVTSDGTFSGTSTPNIASPSTLTTIQTTANSGCEPPDCTYTETGYEHGVIYDQNLDGSTWDMYNSYILNPQGQVAPTSAFNGLTSGASFNAALLNYNFEMDVTASEFQGRSIDIIVAPKMFIQAGLIQ